MKRLDPLKGGDIRNDGGSAIGSRGMDPQGDGRWRRRGIWSHGWTPLLLLWNPVNGWSRSGPTEYHDVLAAMFDAAPSEGELRRAMAGIREEVAETEDCAEVHSHALLDAATWGRFGSLQRGALNAFRGTGRGAVIHLHRSLEEALDAGTSAGATFVPGDGTGSNCGEVSQGEPG